MQLIKNNLSESEIFKAKYKEVLQNLEDRFRVKDGNNGATQLMKTQHMNGLHGVTVFLNT